jgi:capping protein (actin filament) muscle Z-line, beta
MAQPLDVALDLLRRLPPANVVSNLSTLVSIFPHLADDLYSSVDQPLDVRVDRSPEGKGREYLICDYNRDGDSWRSHWSNQYDPPLEGQEEGAAPSKELRQLEIKANEAFDTYRQM